MNIKELLKGGQLKEIEVDEVSLVGAPANGRRFLFTKAADFEFGIKTDQTFSGTTITVNGEELKNVQNFRIWLDDVSEEDMEEWGAEPFSASWTLRESSEDGVDQVSTFSLQSTEVKKMEKSDVIKTLKSAFDIDITEVDFDKLDKEKQDSLTGFCVYSKAFNEPFSKSSAAPAIRSLIAKADPPEETPPESPAETPPETPPAGLTEESVKALIATAIAEANRPPEESNKGEDDEEPSDMEKAVAKLSEDMAAIAKTVGAKLSTETEVEKGAAAGADGWKDNWDVGPE